MSDQPSWQKTLCHPDGKKSCGACCGAYNTPRFSRTDLEATWQTRLQDFPAHPDDQALTSFFAQHHPTPADRLLAALPTCPFVGFLAPDHKLVGCLVHPTRIGRDARDHGVYDRTTCEDYLCAAHSLLRPHEKWLVVHAIEDSTTYGLVISDVRFVRILFQLTAHLNDADLLPHRLMRPEALNAARDYFSLKVDWPHSAPDGVFGQWRAGEDLDTPPRQSPAPSLSFLEEPWDAALICLGTEVDSHAQLEDARHKIRQKIEAFAFAVR